MSAHAAVAAGPVALVVVEYGHDQTEHRLQQLLGRAPAQVAQRVERVRTDIAPGHCLSTPNEAYEFSGYQEGLARLLADAAWRGDGQGTRIVVFVNDTITTSHAAALARYLLDRLTQLDGLALPGAALVGLATEADGPIRDATQGLGYASTYAFALVGRPEQLAQVRFYRPEEVAGRFAQEVLPTLPTDYVDSVRQWLEPEHPLMGWHNAIPGQPLDPATRLRKQLAIHLEHTMPQRLRALGFAFVDLGSLLPPLARLRLRALRLLDRLYINRLKLRVRLPLLLGLQRR